MKFGSLEEGYFPTISIFIDVDDEDQDEDEDTIVEDSETTGIRRRRLQDYGEDMLESHRSGQALEDMHFALVDMYD